MTVMLVHLPPPMVSQFTTKGLPGPKLVPVIVTSSPATKKSPVKSPTEGVNSLAEGVDSPAE
eukprot:1584059-Pyramimonas_sp.AAC.1